MNSLRAAATQFDFKALKKPSDFWDRCEDLAAKATRLGAKVVLFPEYFTLPWLLSHNMQSFERALHGFSDLAEEFHREMHALAQGLHIAIVAGTVPVLENGSLFNRSYVFLPDGRTLQQDKQHLSRAEKEEWGMTPGNSSSIAFDYEGARWAVAISYDIEFPDTAVKLIADDVDLILVPACCESPHSYWRVRHCAQARAIETQCGVIMSAAVGGDSRQTDLPNLCGRAGFFTPCDLAMPLEGILGLGDLNKENAHVAEYDLLSLHQLRVDGASLNRRDVLATALNASPDVSSTDADINLSSSPKSGSFLENSPTSL